MYWSAHELLYETSAGIKVHPSCTSWLPIATLAKRNWQDWYGNEEGAYLAKVCQPSTRLSVDSLPHLHKGTFCCSCHQQMQLESLLGGERGGGGGGGIQVHSRRAKQHKGRVHLLQRPVLQLRSTAGQQPICRSYAVQAFLLESF